MAFSSGNDSGGPMADINVTPLVDVMLVLLIIFIITAPLMSHKVQIKLPEANLDQKDDPAQAARAADHLGGQGRRQAVLERRAITKEILESRLSSAAQLTPQPPLNLRGDSTTKMGTINEVTKIAQDQGMLDIGFVATKDRGQ